MTISRFADLRPCRDATLDDLDSTQLEAYRVELGQRQPGSVLLRLPVEQMLVQIGCAIEEQRNSGPP